LGSEPSGRPPVFLLSAYDDGAEIRLSGGELKAGESYDISWKASDVDARLVMEGVSTFPQTVADGSLNVLMSSAK
jgi:hypothetical protein